MLLTEQLKDMPTDDLIREVNLDDPFFHELRAHIGVTGNWDELGIDKVVVNATYQPDPQGSDRAYRWLDVQLAKAIRRSRLTFSSTRTDPPGAMPIRRRCSSKICRISRAGSRPRQKEFTEQRELVIQPANEFRPLIIDVEAGAIDWSKTRQVDALLKYSDPDNHFHAEQLFTFRQDKLAPQKWVIYPKNPDLRGYEVNLTYSLNDANSTVFRLAPTRSTEEALVVPGPFRGEPWRIQLIPAVDPEEVREISAEILYEKVAIASIVRKTSRPMTISRAGSRFRFPIPIPRTTPIPSAGP